MNTNKKVIQMKKVFILLFAALVCACTGQQGGNTADELPELSWGTASLCIENPVAPDAKECYHIEINLDTLEGGSELAKQLGAVLQDSVLYMSGYASIREAMTTVVDSLESEWKAELVERYDPDSEYKDYYTMSGSPEDNGQDSIVSYMTQTDCYLGGAHGSHVVQYFNFNRESGKLLNISDIVPAEKEMLVLEAMGDKLCEDWGAKDLADLQEKTGITMLGDLYLTNNFLLKGDSILFLFNQYEIAPYAAGLISVTLPRP